MNSRIVAAVSSLLALLLSSGGWLSTFGEELPSAKPWMSQLTAKVERLEREGRYGLARKLLGESAVEARSFDACAELAGLWLEVDERLTCELSAFAESKGVARTAKARDALDGERSLQDRFDREFPKKWYGFRLLRNPGFAVAERRWLGARLNEWLRESEEVINAPGHREALEEVRSRYEILRASQADLDKLSVRLVQHARTPADEVRASELSRQAETARKHVLSERARWLSYGYASPYLGNASFWCWKAVAVDERRADKQASLRKAFTAIETVSHVLPETNEEIRAQFGLLREDLRKAVDRRDPGFERDLEKLERVARSFPVLIAW